MQPLSTLPQREGFKFRGIPKDGSRYLNCRLKHLPGVGIYIAASGRYTYEDVTAELAGWEKHPPRICSHAWILNVKPAVCLWCGARKQTRTR